MTPKPIYLHEYTITSWNKEKLGIQQIVVTIVTETQEKELFEVTEQMEDFLESGINIAHKILMEGYLDDSRQSESN